MDSSAIPPIPLELSRPPPTSAQGSGKGTEWWNHGRLVQRWVQWSIAQWHAGAITHRAVRCWVSSMVTHWVTKSTLSKLSMQWAVFNWALRSTLGTAFSNWRTRRWLYWAISRWRTWKTPDEKQLREYALRRRKLWLMHNVWMSRVLKRALRQWREPFKSGRGLALKHDDFVAGWRQQRAKSVIDLLRVQAWNEQRLELLSCSFPGRQQRLYLRRWHLGSLQHNKQLLDKQVLAEYSLVRHCPHTLSHTHAAAVRIAAAVLL